MVEISLADPATILAPTFCRHMDVRVFLAQSNHSIGDAYSLRICTVIAESDSALFEKVH
jgi:hypothetical protein